jgi:hypothetical protein
MTFFKPIFSTVFLSVFYLIFRDLEVTDFERVKVFCPTNPTQVIEIYRYKEYRSGANRRAEILPNLQNPERCPVRMLDFYMDKR